jgi:hypothetical protein
VLVEDRSIAETQRPIPPLYERLRIERVLSPGDLEGEILYAGTDTLSRFT